MQKTTLPKFLDDYVAAALPPTPEAPTPSIPNIEDGSLLDIAADDIAADQKARYPGPYTSSAPSPYEASPLCGSEIEQDAKQSRHGLFNARDPHYPILHEKWQHRVICFLKAQGLSNVEISRQTGMTAVAVSNVVRQPWAQQRIAEIICEAGQDAVQQLLAGAEYDSVQRLIEERDNMNARPSDRINAADKLLDRIRGKPPQSLNHNVSNRVEDLTDEQLEAIIRQGRGGGTSTATSPSP